MRGHRFVTRGVSFCLRASVLLGALAVVAREATAQGAAQCRKAMEGCNEADWFSGTITWSSVLQVKGDPLTSGIVGTAREDMTMTVTTGQVVCAGSTSEKSESWSRNRLGSRTTTVGAIQGPGLLFIEFGRGTDTLRGQPIYHITVVCPGARGQVTYESFIPPSPARVDTLEWGPAKMGNGDMESYVQLDTGTGKVLKGKLTGPHPDSDSVNAVVGTITMSWSLTRIAKPGGSGGPSGAGAARRAAISSASRTGLIGSEDQ